VTREETAKGLALLGTAFNRALSDELVGVYHGVLARKLSAVQWERAVCRALEAETFFPPPAVLLRYGVANGSLAARASEAFEVILECYSSGEHLRHDEIAGRFGKAARDAYLAAGGRAVFDLVGGEGQERARSFALRDFTAAWRETVEADAMAALPPGNEDRAELEAGDPGPDDARALMRAIGQRAGGAA
jgi:hypothetical protein